MNDLRARRFTACGIAALAAAASGWFGCTPEPPAAGHLTPVDRAGLDAVIERHRGQVVLVDIWATWCLPCIELLPHTIELAAREHDRGLAVVTLSLDDAQSARRAGTLLETMGANRVTNLISALGGGSKAAEAFEIPGGALPHFKLYDRTGKLRRTFGIDPSATTQFTPADIDSAVAELLAE